MNRRTFLQSVGAFVVIPTIPAIAKTPEPQWIDSGWRRQSNYTVSLSWIDFVDQMPSYGQKIAFCTYFDNGKSINIATGKVVHKVIKPDKHFYWLHESTALIEMAVSHSPDGFFRNGKGIHGKPADVFCDICVYDPALLEPREETQRKIHRANWIDCSKETVYPIPCMTLLAPRHDSRCSEYVGRDRSYWFPITDYIPENLPALPEPLPLILDGEGNLLK